MKSKFDFYEIVKVITDKPSCAQINGELGVVSGKAQNEETGKWTYGISIYSDDDLVWCVDEKDIYPTGKKADPKDHYTGETIKVRVDPKTGKGYLVDPE
jgi:hypothetical protein